MHAQQVQLRDDVIISKRSTWNSCAGFTMMELVIVLAILATMAVVVVPKASNMLSRARLANERGIVAGIRAGIQFFSLSMVTGQIDTVGNDYGGTTSQGFPNNLDPNDVTNGMADDDNRLFSVVLTHGSVTDSDWEKLDHTYTAPSGSLYVYTPQTGNLTASAEETEAPLTLAEQIAAIIQAIIQAILDWLASLFG
jgi:prepilin-type N-terminal cleavage/methylation domain-containing protein